VTRQNLDEFLPDGTRRAQNARPKLSFHIKIGLIAFHPVVLPLRQQSPLPPTREAEDASRRRSDRIRFLTNLVPHDAASMIWRAI
jgi:hypothetical protein